MRSTTPLRLTLIVLGVSACLAMAAASRPAAATVSRLAVLQAEDQRAATAEELRLLLDAARTGTPDVQRLAVRALGRLERPDLTTDLLPLLSAPDAGVRAETANALAQAIGRDLDRAAPVRAGLLQRLVGEVDPDVRAAIGEALGRIPHQAPADIEQAERALVDIISRTQLVRRLNARSASTVVGVTLAPTSELIVPTAALIGGLRGLESLARLRGKIRPLSMPTIERLRELTTHEAPPGRSRDAAAASEEAARVRRLALLTLNTAGAIDADLARRILGDPDDQVRRFGVLAPAADRAAVDRGLADRSWLVRYEALRVYGRRFQATAGCAPIVDAIGGTVDHVALLAIDLLGDACRPEDHAVETLVTIAVSLGAVRDNPATTSSSVSGWHRPAHAIVALAKAAPQPARSELTRFLTAEPWHVRLYAARAAALLGETGALRALATDPNDNVREAAIAGLSRLLAHEADDLYVQALGAADHQLVMAAARALAKTPNRAPAVAALLAALTRLTASDSDPSRDPRTAILDRLQELGGPEQEAALTPYLEDVDSRIAERAARVLTAWTGRPVTARPRPRRPDPLTMTEADLDRLARTTVRMTMRAKGTFELRLLADLAPVSCARFVRLAAEGYYTGLTFHRILPNFLIQGGSPGANEYMGYRRYLRDELGRPSQRRGTLGTSTRGRDTGDSQIYLNLVDNPRLDHDYTIFAEVVRGMEVVDSILEGDVIERVEVVVARR